MPTKFVVLTPVKVNSVVLTPCSLVGGYWRLYRRSWQRVPLKGRVTKPRRYGAKNQKTTIETTFGEDEFRSNEKV